MDIVPDYYDRYFPWLKLSTFYAALPESVGYFPKDGTPWIVTGCAHEWPGVLRKWPRVGQFISINTSGYGALRFDFDIPESMSKRCGCGEACDRCLTFALEWAETSLRILTEELLPTRDFKYILSFSGRRGFHLEINIMETCADIRRAYVGYMNYSAKGVKAFMNNPDDWAEQYPFWEKRYNEVLSDEGNAALVSAALHDVLQMTGGPPSLNRKERSLRDWIEGEISFKAREKPEAVSRLRHMLWYQLFAPRIDYHVTCDARHMCKLPHSVHPKTRRIAVTIDSRRPFVLSDVPTVDEIMFGMKPPPQCLIWLCDVARTPALHLRRHVVAPATVPASTRK